MRKEVDPVELAELAEVFRKYGADDPESWARSQLAEGFPQLAVFSFLKAMWQGVMDENDLGLVDRMVATQPFWRRGPSAVSIAAVEEMLAKGVERQSIIDLMRVSQFEGMMHVACVLDRCSEYDVPISEWMLIQTDKDGNQVASLWGLHESFMGMDPTGREMGPRKSE